MRLEVFRLFFAASRRCRYANVDARVRCQLLSNARAARYKCTVNARIHQNRFAQSHSLNLVENLRMNAPSLCQKKSTSTDKGLTCRHLAGEVATMPQFPHGPVIFVSHPHPHPTLYHFIISTGRNPSHKRSVIWLAASLQKHGGCLQPRRKYQKAVNIIRVHVAVES